MRTTMPRSVDQNQKAGEGRTRKETGVDRHQPQRSVDQNQKAGEGSKAFVWRREGQQLQGGCEESQPQGGEKTTDTSLGKAGGGTTGQPQKSIRSQRKNAGSKKRVWKQTDPLDFPANEYHWPLFKCNHPFITRKKKLPAFNKFGQLKMNKEVRFRALKFLLEPYLNKHRKLDSNGELSGCQLHVALFENIWLLTTPSQFLLENIHEMEMDREMRFNRKRRRMEKLVDMMVHKQGNIDFALSEVVPSKGNESDEGSEDDENSAEEEEAEEEEETELLDGFSEGTNESFRPDDGEESGRGRIDLKIWVYNSSNSALQDLFKVVDDMDTKKTVCIIECKWDKKGRNKAMYQVACYACQEAVKNMGNLHFGPIYLIIVCESEWTYGILDPRGTIGILNGKVEAASYQVFKKQEGVRIPSNPTSFECLEALLSNSTKYYQQHFLNSPDAIYPARTYLVGTLYVDDKWYKLPAFGTPGGGNAYHVHVFYEGLLRIVIGDKVTDWDMSDFEAAKSLKERLLEIEKELFFYTE